MISSGSGLQVTIHSPYSFVNDWMCFSLCYSIRKILPEASIVVKTVKNFSIDKQYFVWLPVFKPSKMKICNELLITEPSFVLIRPISIEIQETLFGQLAFCDDNMWSEVKEDKFTPFVSYKEGCARFVMSDWINSNEYPFPYADRLVNEGMCPNETQVLRLWKQMNALYPLLVKG